MTRQQALQDVTRRLNAYNARVVEKNFRPATVAEPPGYKDRQEGVLKARREAIASLPGETQEIFNRASHRTRERQKELLALGYSVKTYAEYLEVMNDRGEWCPWFIQATSSQEGTDES